MSWHTVCPITLKHGVKLPSQWSLSIKPSSSLACTTLEYLLTCENGRVWGLGLHVTPQQRCLQNHEQSRTQSVSNNTTCAPPLNVQFMCSWSECHRIAPDAALRAQQVDMFPRGAIAWFTCTSDSSGAAASFLI